MLQAELNDYKFNYVEHGNGKNLVFVHGSASDYRTWDNQLREFGNHYHSIAYSRRYHWPNKPILDGKDYSMAQHVEDLEEFLLSLSNKPVHLVGHSYGAFICLLLSIRNSKLIRTLTLAEPPVITLFVSNSPKPVEILNLLFTKPKLALAIIKFGSTGIAPATKALIHNDLEKALDIFGKATLGTQTFLNLSEERQKQAQINFIKAELLGSGFSRLDKIAVRQITLPTLLISGQNSPRLFQYLLYEIKKLIPQSELRMVPDSSHIMHEDNAPFYNSTLMAFLKKYDQT